MEVNKQRASENDEVKTTSFFKKGDFVLKRLCYPKEKGLFGCCELLAYNNCCRVSSFVGQVKAGNVRWCAFS